jgi:hypothetical protein
MLRDMEAMTAFHCDADSAAEAYVMNRIPTKERNRFNLHLKRCAYCRLEVARTGDLSERSVRRTGKLEQIHNRMLLRRCPHNMNLGIV